MTDYLAFRRKEEGDAEQHGIKGMRWGIVRDTATKARDHLSRKSKGEEVTKTKKAAAVEKKAEPDNPGLKAAHGEESSAQRYARLTSQAKGGGANSMSEQDLKFFNARTDALAKINKMNQTDPGWLSKTSKSVLQNAAQKTMQDIANGITNKYVTNPVLDALEPKK